MTSGTLARTIILVLALLNQLLTAMGYAPLPIEDDVINNGVAAIFTAGAAIAAWWKNNSFTPEAVAADYYLKKLKNKEVK